MEPEKYINLFKSVIDKYISASKIVTNSDREKRVNAAVVYCAAHAIEAKCDSAWKIYLSSELVSQIEDVVSYLKSLDLSNYDSRVASDINKECNHFIKYFDKYIEIEC